MLVTAGVVLAPRPLSAVVLLLGAIAVALAAWALSVIRQARRRLGPWTAALVLGAAAVLVLVFLPQVARALPVAAAMLLAGNAVRLLGRALRRRPAGEARAGDVPGDRVLAVASALACGGGAVLAWLWPDVALVAIGSGFGVALAVVGLIVLVRAVDRRPGRGAREPRGVARRRLAPRVVGVVVALAVVGAASSLSVSLRSSVTHVDAFYTWDGGIPAVPGELLRSEPYTGELPAEAEAFRILYATTYSDGTPALASAVIAFPKASSDGDRTVLAWQHGTTGVARPCAPSASTGALTEYAIPGISRAIERGWAVVATDYPGQGTPGRYPYLIGEGEGRASLDGVRAIGQFTDAHASDRVMIWGHSQGGHATLWAGEIAADYAPELDVVGVAALSAAADPLYLAERITTGGGGALSDLITSFVLVPYADEYADVDLGASVHPAGQTIVTALASRCVTDSTALVSVLLVGQALNLDAPLYRIDVTSGAIHARLAQNVADGMVPAPLFLGQGADDEVIPTAIQTSLSRSLCAAGRTVETHLYPGRTHMGVVAEGSPLIDDLFTWADAVVGGAHPTTCGG